ncbi:GNAT family N-acetyltransferase [Streptomyces sp. BI20]|uniref:GNAT family N-acetyltransferase n=1 Tax=Streptomyces sp. BI20 TaxID=3403460 RepID=UPI003C7126A9
MSDAFPLATGPRTTLHALRAEDSAEFTAAARAARSLHGTWLAPPVDAETFAAWAGPLVAGETRAGFLLRDRSDGALVGFVNVNNIVRGAFQCGALGYGAFPPAAGTGRFGEGFGLLLRHAFAGPDGGGLGLHRLEANIRPGNDASRALVRRHGFRLEGLSPDFLFVDGAWRDHERWALTAEMRPEPANS